MGVYIKGLEMPKKGLVEIIIAPDGICYELERPLIDTEHAKVTKYPDAIAVPDHGDLIDRDALIKNLRDYACKPCKEYGADKNGDRCAWCSFDDAFARIEKAKAVIHAEGSEDATD